MYEFVYVGKIPSLRQVLLNSRLHFSLVTLAEAFSISRTDFRCCDGSRKMRKPRDPTDMLIPQTTPTNLFHFPTFPVTFTHFQGKHFRSYYFPFSPLYRGVYPLLTLPPKVLDKMQLTASVACIEGSNTSIGFFISMT